MIENLSKSTNLEFRVNFVPFLTIITGKKHSDFKKEIKLITFQFSEQENKLDFSMNFKKSTCNHC